MEEDPPDRPTPLRASLAVCLSVVARGEESVPQLHYTPLVEETYFVAI
jgi:hypothetical protein